MLDFTVQKRINVHTKHGKEYALQCTDEVSSECWTLFTWDNKPSVEEIRNTVSILRHAMKFALNLTQVKIPDINTKGIDYYDSTD